MTPKPPPPFDTWIEYVAVKARMGSIVSPEQHAATAEQISQMAQIELIQMRGRIRHLQDLLTHSAKRITELEAKHQLMDGVRIVPPLSRVLPVARPLHPDHVVEPFSDADDL